MKKDKDQQHEIMHLPVARSPSSQQELATYDPYLNSYVPEDEIDLRGMWNTIIKYRWAVFAFLGVVVVTTIFATFLMRPVYKATALIEIMSETRGGLIKLESLEGVGRQPEERLINTQASILRSRSIAKAVVEKLNLGAHTVFVEEQKQRGFVNGLKGLFRTSTVEEQERQNNASANEALFGQISSTLQITPIRRSNLVEVSFESFVPELAARVANTVVGEYIRLNEERRFNSTSGAKAFLGKEIRRIQARLETSEKDLTEFARKNQIVDVEENSNIMTGRLTELNAALTKVEGDRIAAQAAYKQAQISNVEALPAVLNGGHIGELKARYATLQGEYFKLSRVFKDAYPKIQQLKAQMEQARKGMDAEVRRVVAGLKVSYEQLLRKEALLRKSVEQQKTALLDLKDRAIQYNILKREWETNKQLYSGLLERMKEVGVAAGMELNNVALIDKAEIPKRPYKPDLLLNISLALVLGLIGGVGLAFLLAYLDNTVRTPEEVEALLRLANLGVVPKIDLKSVPEGANIDLLSHHKRDSELSESFRSLRTSLMFSTPEGMPKVLLVTSASMKEGKSTTAVNLAVVLAQNDARVLLLDCDLRKPRLHRVFGFPCSPGVTEHLVGEHQNAIHDTDIPNLSFMASGTPPPNPAELLSSGNMDALIKSMGKMYDYIIIDSAPTLGLADSLITSTKVKGVLLVMHAGHVSKDVLRETVKRLRNVRAPLVGAILNMIDPLGREYGYYNRYYYSHDYKHKKEELENISAHG